MQNTLVYVGMFLLPSIFGSIGLMIGNLFGSHLTNTISLVSAISGTIMGILISISYMYIARYYWISVIALILNIIILINLAHGLYLLY